MPELGRRIVLSGIEYEIRSHIFKGQTYFYYAPISSPVDKDEPEELF